MPVPKISKKYRKFKMTPRFDYWHKDERILMKNQASKEIDPRPRRKRKKNLQKLPQKYYIGCQ